MSILIKGVGIPTSCESCPCKTTDAFGGLGCQATGYIPLRKANQDRPDWCPLDALTISTAVPLDGKPYQYVHIDNIKGAPAISSAEEGKT